MKNFNNLRLTYITWILMLIVINVLVVLLSKYLIVENDDNVSDSKQQSFVHCELSKSENDFWCEFTNLSDKVIEECVVIEINCMRSGTNQTFISDEICSGWLMPLTTHGQKAVSWTTPDDSNFPPKGISNCSDPCLAQRHITTAEQFIQDFSNLSLVKWTEEGSNE